MSSDLVQFPPLPPTRQIYLIGFRLDPGAEQPQFYTLMGDEGESERPITREGRILFFRHPKDARKALKESDNGFADLTPVPHDRQGAEEQVMTVETISLDDVVDMISAGQIIDAKSIIGLMLTRSVVS